MSQHLDKQIIVAKIGAAHGVKGDLKLHSYSSPPSNILSYKHWFIKHNKAPWQPLKNAHIKQCGNQFIIHFNDCDSREQAKSYTHALLAVPRSELPKLSDDEGYYWADLEQLTVVSPKGKTLGTVKEIMNTGANDIIVMQTTDHKTHLIPYIPNVVLQVDLDNQTIVVDWDINY